VGSGRELEIEAPIGGSRILMATDQELQVKLPSGVSLEVKLCFPKASTSEGGTGLAVLLHPWSWLGGRMEDQYESSLIVHRSQLSLERFARVLAFVSNIILNECGYRVLLFNSRGVGKSSGWPSFTGLTEGQNLEELVQWGIGAVANVKSVVLIVRGVDSLMGEISSWSLGLLAWSSHNVSTPRSTYANQNLTSITLVCFGS
jgi:alpha/beta superfamily hydrolase